MRDTTLFEAIGGAEGVLRLAHAWHRRVMADEIVAHAFSHGFHPRHTERLAAYWGEAWGGPTTYSQRYGSESSVVRMHSGNGPHEEMDRRAIECFDRALDDVGVADPVLRGALHEYFAWATTNSMASYPESADKVPGDLRIPRWSWEGLTPNPPGKQTMTTLSPNAQLVTAIFEELAKGNGAAFWDACHEDVVWRTIGEGSWSGEFVGKQTIIDEIFRPLSRVLVERATIPTRLIDGDNVIVLQARGRNLTRDGQRYDNDYAFVIHFRDGKIARYEEYCDTDLIARVLPDRIAAKSMSKPT